MGKRGRQRSEVVVVPDPEVAAIVETERVTISLPLGQYRGIRRIVEAVPGEVVGWAEGEVLGDCIRMLRICVPEQEASSGHAELMGVDFVKCAAAGEIDPSRAFISWHSHGNIAACFSGTDEVAYAQFSKLMPVLVALVTNKADQWSAQVLVRLPGGSTLKLPAKVEVESVPDPDWIAPWVELVKKRVKAPVYVGTGHGAVGGSDKLPIHYRGGLHNYNAKPEWEIGNLECEKRWTRMDCDAPWCEERESYYRIMGKLGSSAGFGFMTLCMRDEVRVRVILSKNRVLAEDTRTLYARSSDIFEAIAASETTPKPGRGEV